MGFLTIALFTTAFAMVARRLSTTIITPPMIFLGFGALMAILNFVELESAEHLLHLVAEITLVVILFLDAAQIDLKALQRQHTWPVRMLFVGLPLALLLGTVFAAFLMPSIPLVAAALIAAILMPTDAALGQAVVTNPKVPDRVRRALTVESGLNDGLALPAVLLFASLTAEVMDGAQANWLIFTAKQLVFGPLVGVAIGFAGGAILLVAKKHMLTADIYEGVGALALAGSAYLAADIVDGNGFISAFAAGLAFGNRVRGKCKFVYEFTESEGQLLTWSAFLLIGIALVPTAIAHLTPAMFTLILTSLVVVRPVAIWISLIGTDAAPTTRLFMGWFGPRGLATALFALVVMESVSHELVEPILAIAVNAVWISALLHGVTAAPFASWYGRLVQARGDCPEMQPIQNTAKPLTTRGPVGSNSNT